MRLLYFTGFGLLLAAAGFLFKIGFIGIWLLLIALAVVALGIYDLCQGKHSICRNFPVVGHGRYLAELLRPPIRQYYMESDLDGAPLNRRSRSVVYQRAKGQKDTIPFGTQSDVYQPGYEWLGHSLTAINSGDEAEELRVTIGGSQCKQPYSSSILNISAMSFGSLSNRAIEALNGGAKIGDFAHNTGEGGVSPYHLEAGGDLIWQIGTGYFGCREKDGSFSKSAFIDTAAPESVKMIELKLSQGAKPGHGGILPGKKNTPEIAEIRGVEPGTTVHSPAAHTAFDSPTGLLEFIAELREACGGKPTGFKLCLGRPEEFVSICKAIVETRIYPDFIAVDGGEGGTGAAPPEYSNSIGTPLRDGLAFALDCLNGFDLKKDIVVMASGKIITGFDVIRNIALGADVCQSARAMMLALGCIQALECHKNNCPTGVATQDPNLVAGLVVADKEKRVAQYHKETVEAAREIIASMGFSAVSELKREHIFRRVDYTRVSSYEEIYPSMAAGDIVDGSVPAHLEKYFASASANSFLVNASRTPG